MAAIPTYLYFGNEMIAGGAQPNTQVPDLWGFWQNNYRFNRVVPSGPNGLTGGTFDPYWDGTLDSGAGDFTKYHHAADFYFAPAKGDNWYNGTGGGVTPCTMLMNAIWDRHPSGFKLLKYGKSSAGYASWKPGGAAWIEAKAEYDAMVAAVAPDTLDIKACIIDCSTSDVVLGSLTFSADLQAFITGFRSDYSSSAKLILVSHGSDFYLPGGTQAQAARTLHQNAKNANANVSIFDMSWAEYGTDGPVGSVTLGPNQITYETNDYLEAGVRLGRHIDLLLTSQPLNSVGGAIETHVIIGDSNAMCAFMSPQIVALGDQQTLLGSPGGTERAGEWIWDHVNKEVVPYDVLGVTNSFGSTDQVFGPECTMLKRLKKKARERAQNPDVCVFKFAAGGAQFTFVESAFPEIQEGWEEFKAAVYRDTGRIIDCRSVTVMIGRNDGMSAAGAVIFADKYLDFVDDLRETFTTRSDGPELAIVWVQPSPHADTGVVGGTTVGEAASLASVRSMIAALPTVKDRVAVLLDPGETYELQRSDMLHYGAEAVYQIGYDAADAIAELNSDEGGTDEDSDTGDTPSGSAAFVVETGTGSATANSYCTVAFADSYHDSIGNPSLWLSATNAAKENALRVATLQLDLKYAGRWSGVQASSEQALAWPRTGAFDAALNEIDDEEIPTRLKQAAARGALFVLDGKDLVPQSLTGGDIESESKSMAGGFSKSVTYRGAKPASEDFVVLDHILMSGGLISYGGGWGYGDA